MAFDESSVDLIIGPDQHIRSRTWPSDQPTPAATDVDRLLSAAKGLWERLELECQKDCCGIEAFGFLPNDILAAVGGTEREAVRSELTRMRNEISALRTSYVVTSHFNQYMERSALVALLDHVVATLADKNTAD